ncbi:MAG: flagellar biosynthesis repressor FlbT [Pseudomonadota bacterium]
MALKIELKPGERFIVGDAVITNQGNRAKLLVEGDAPILREKDILTPETANSPSKRIYLVVQLLYLGGRADEHVPLLNTLAEDLMTAAPSMAPYVESVTKAILTNDLYKALKEAKAMIAYEKELIGHATGSSASIRTDSTTDSQST